MARPYPSNINLPKGKIDIKEIRKGSFRIFFTPPKEALRSDSLNPKDYRRPIIDINFDKQTLTMYPYRVWSIESMQPRYYKLTRITIETSVPEAYVPTVVDIAGILEMELPSVFTIDYNYGLGFRKEYRHIVEMLEEIGVKHLKVSNYVSTSISVDKKEAIFNS